MHNSTITDFDYLYSEGGYISWKTETTLSI